MVFGLQCELLVCFIPCKAAMMKLTVLKVRLKFVLIDNSSIISIRTEQTSD